MFFSRSSPPGAPCFINAQTPPAVSSRRGLPRRQKVRIKNKKISFHALPALTA
nr:MAG TPA: hypothetical protein [Caudoviricetes sp.]